MKKLLLVIESIPHSEQRYDTAGDWFIDDDGVVRILVSDDGNRVDNLLIGLHEAVEAILCREHGVLETDVTAFDVAHLDDDEPGEHPEAPYRREHAIADAVERIVAADAGVKWREYGERLAALESEVTQ